MSALVLTRPVGQAKTFSYKAGDEILKRGSIERNLYHILRGTTVCLSSTGQVCSTAPAHGPAREARGTGTP